VTYHRASLLPVSMAALTSIRRPELNSVASPGRHNHTIRAQRHGPSVLKLIVVSDFSPMTRRPTAAACLAANAA